MPATQVQSRSRVPEWFGDWFKDKFPPGEGPFRPPEVWETVGCSKDAVYRAIHNKRIEAMRIGGRYIIPRRALREWVRDTYYS